MRELVSNNSLFVGQLKEDKSLALHALDQSIVMGTYRKKNYSASKCKTSDVSMFDNITYHR